ncbi:ferredoxin [Zoogloea sp.]|uniref:(2Fe-2S) ferredoxin domain-containing protein n=1 Tax=Zoogloea sp. TaxID=49181 RepID=UPI0035ADC3F6|nr:(2Fe-2S) ferredoxin domain-containing protein [Rhodocyclales bacterium]
MPKPKKHILVCVQGRPPGHPRGSCQEKGCNALWQAFQQEFQQRNLWAEYLLTNTGCLGPCQAGPNVLIYPDNVMYSGVTVADIPELIEQHLQKDTPVERLKAPAGVW